MGYTDIDRQIEALRREREAALRRDQERIARENADRQQAVLAEEQIKRLEGLKERQAVENMRRQATMIESEMQDNFTQMREGFDRHDIDSVLAAYREATDRWGRFVNLQWAIVNTDQYNWLDLNWSINPFNFALSLQKGYQGDELTLRKGFNFILLGRTYDVGADWDPARATLDGIRNDDRHRRGWY